ncbi:YmdB family metallophosphoesterase [Meiothermus sp. QL-1]|uniref:TIGR00282 family metallophosphoesterase n=1 Tax=Meiothermus sp. QL-1 TaxID=2058095 RepID=UPI000E0B7F4F|nr:TIGR00282 family metallophosphoesterase [Meiothermus sp. QL-1]RDI96160.1 YmdB family metallophosphoesterase [Meiothermus sp. QL-1]
MRVLFVGDVFGDAGLRVVASRLPDLRPQYDFVIVNGENAHHGKGLSRPAYRKLREAGADLITLGNHAWDHRDVYELIETEPILRALNYPPGTPGRGHWVLETGGERLLVMQVMGQVEMGLNLYDPFRTPEALLEEVPHDYALLEVHAEATSEKYALGHYFDGRIAALLGTHTHVPTADAGFLPRGTAFQCDVGMTGPLHSIIGGEVESFLARFLTQRPTPFRAAQGRAVLSATELVLEGGRCTQIRPLRWEEPWI